MGSVTADAIESNHPLNVPLLLDSRALTFKIDTGADVTVIPESKYLGKSKSLVFVWLSLHPLTGGFSQMHKRKKPALIRFKKYNKDADAIGTERS